MNVYQSAIHTVIPATLSLCLIGCSQAPKPQEEPLASKTEEDLLLESFLEVQKSISEGDFDTFTKHLGRDLLRLTRADPNEVRGHFFGIVRDHGRFLYGFFKRDNYFILHNADAVAEDQVYYLPFGGTPKLVFPTQEQMNEAKKLTTMLKECREELRKARLEDRGGNPAKEALEAELEAKHDALLDKMDKFKANNQEAFALGNMPKELAKKINDRYAPRRLHSPSLLDELSEQRSDYDEHSNRIPYVITLEYEGYRYCKFTWPEARGYDHDFGFNVEFVLSDDGKWGMNDMP